MGRIAVVLAVLVATVGPARAGDPNRWQAWVTPDDKNSKGVDVSMVTAMSTTCQKPFIALQPRVRNRYQERIAGKLKIEHVDTGGAAATLADFELDIGETRVLPTTYCHDARSSLAFSIAEFRFPVREAEAAKLAAQKAAAEQAAAEEAKKRKAAAEAAAAEQAAAEAALRKRAEETAERERVKREQHEREVAAQKAEQQRDLAAQHDQQAESVRYREQRAAEAIATSSGTAPQSALPTERLRNGEIIVAAPIGFQTASWSERESGLSVGVRGAVRAFKWIKILSEPGQPLSAAGFEVTVGGGWSKVTDLLSRGSSSVSVASGNASARFWWGTLGIGVFGDWTRHAREGTSGAQAQSLFALGPELCLGIVAGRTIALEASVKAGAVASGNGLTAGTSKDAFLSAAFVVEFFRFYGGAVASKYHELSTGDVPNSWNALGVLGVRLPF